MQHQFLKTKTHPNEQQTIFNESTLMDASFSIANVTSTVHAAVIRRLANYSSTMIHTHWEVLGRHTEAYKLYKHTACYRQVQTGFTITQKHAKA